MAEHVTTGELETRFARFMRTHRKTMHRYFQSIGLFNGNPHMLFHIRRTPGITQKELAERMDISPASVAVSIRRLESAALIRRERDGKDGRVMHLYLTPEGETMDAACARGKEFLMRTAYQGFTDEERDILYRLLDIMTHNLQEAAETLSVKGENDQ